MLVIIGPKACGFHIRDRILESLGSWMACIPQMHMVVSLILGTFYKKQSIEAR